MIEIWQQAVVEAFQETMRRVAHFMPYVLATLILLIVGLLAGWGAKTVLHRLLRALRFDSLCERWGVTATIAASGVRRQFSDVVGRIAFWTIFLLFAFMAVNALNLEATSSLVNAFLTFLPHLFAAALLLVAGWLLSNFLAEAALIGLVNAQIQEARLAASLIRWGILIFALAMVLTQLGIGKEIVVAAFSITFGGIVLALAIAVGLGGKDVAREALERRLQQKHAAKEEPEDIAHL